MIHTITYDRMTISGLIVTASRLETEAEEFEGPDGTMMAVDLNYWHPFTEALEVARKALEAAAPKPEAVSRTVPSDEDILALVKRVLALETADAEWLHFARALLSRYGQPATSAEPLVRYCPGCGSIGPVDTKYRDCCPDGGEARMIPQALAEKCRETFKVAVKAMMADEAANDSAPVAAQAQPAVSAEPVAWMHDEPGRVDVIHAAVKKLLHDSHEAAGYLHRPLDKSERCTIPLYAAPIAAQPSVPAGLIAALRNQRQIDRDGTEVAVSRQAVDGAADILGALSTTAPQSVPKPRLTPQMIKAFRHAYVQGSIWTDRLTRAVEALWEAAPLPPTRAQPDEPVKEAIDERAQFEASARNHGLNLARHGDSGEYENRTVQGRWVTWQDRALLDRCGNAAQPGVIRVLVDLYALVSRLPVKNIDYHIVTAAAAAIEGSATPPAAEQEYKS